MVIKKARSYYVFLLEKEIWYLVILFNKEEVDIAETDNAGTLHDKLMKQALICW